MKMSGSAGLFNKKNFFFYLVGSPKVGGAGDGKHKKKYGHPNRIQISYRRRQKKNCAAYSFSQVVRTNAILCDGK